MINTATLSDIVRIVFIAMAICVSVACCDKDAIDVLKGGQRHMVQLTAVEFEAVYSAYRPFPGPFCEYKGVMNGQHTLYVYSLVGGTSIVNRRGIFVIPENEMPATFPSKPQQPVSYELCEQEKAEWLATWRKLFERPELHAIQQATRGPPPKP